MERPIISVIVPVYNAGDTLSRCVDSVLAQSFGDFEVLLVDDGSTDSSAKICDEYAAKDSRVRVFHKENGGVSSARNVGLDHALGEWICFCDADDALVDGALCFDFASCTEDLLMGDYYDNEVGHAEHGFLEDGSFAGQELMAYYERNITHSTFHVIWGKLYRRNLVGELRFDRSMRVGEDTLFFLQCLKRVKRARFLSKALCIHVWPNDFKWKYSLAVGDAIAGLSKILDAYLDLGIQSRGFETNKFTDFKSLCQERITATPRLWYADKKVKRIYARIKGGFTLEYRLRYFLMSIPLFSWMMRRRKQR